MRKVKKVKKNENYERLTKTSSDPKPLMRSDDTRPKRKPLKTKKRK